MSYWQIFFGFEWEGRPYGPLVTKNLNQLLKVAYTVITVLPIAINVPPSKN